MPVSLFATHEPRGTQNLEKGQTLGTPRAELPAPHQLGDDR